MDGMGSDISDIAGNTGSMAKSLEVSGEELEYLRDIAESILDTSSTQPLSSLTACWACSSPA